MKMLPGNLVASSNVRFPPIPDTSDLACCARSKIINGPHGTPFSMTRSLHVTAAVLAMLASSPVQAQSVVLGLGRAEDGDTLIVGETKVRLFGIDAPEFDQSCSRQGANWSCGAAAADELMQLVTGKDVRCV